MKQLVQEGVDYWFYLSPKVYVVDKENIFLYLELYMGNTDSLRFFIV